MKRNRKGICLILSLLFLLTTIPVFAEGNTLSPEERQEILTTLEEKNVPKEKWDGLLDKIERGEPLDSMKEEYRNLKPQEVKDGYSITRYPDGSFLVVGVIKDITNEEEIKNSALGARERAEVTLAGKLVSRGVEESKIEGLLKKFRNGETFDYAKEEYRDLKPQYDKDGVKRTDYPDGSYLITITNDDITKSKEIPWNLRSPVKVANAYMENIVVAMYYDVKYRQSPQTNEATILSIYNYNVRVVGGTYSDDGIGHLDGWRNPTHAWYAIKARAFKGIAERRYWLKFYVNGTTTWQDHNGYLNLF